MKRITKPCIPNPEVSEYAKKANDRLLDTKIKLRKLKERIERVSKKGRSCRFTTIMESIEEILEI